MTSQETNTTPVIDLSISRARIDEIDAQIIELFERRMHIAADVAAYKRATGKPVLDKAREAAKIDKATELASDEFKKFIPPLFSMMMEMSRAYQHSLLDDGSEGVVPAAIDEVAELPAAAHVAVQGVEGAYQHIACRELFVDPDIVFVSTFDAVADAVEEGRVEYGILPLENSTAGTVDRVYDLLYKRGLYIARAITLRINHDLLAKPGVEASDIVEVFSHEQALRQCTDFIAQMPNEVTSTACRNTAMAASSVANSERRDVAAISSTACAELYGLNVLQHAIQDEADNFTRFICVAKKPQLVGVPERSSLLLITPHEAGALFRVLSRIAALGVNMREARKPSHSRQRIRVYVLCRYRMHAERCRVRRSNCPNRAALRFSRLSWQLCRGVGVNGWRYSFYGAGPIRVLTPARILSAPARARGET